MNRFEETVASTWDILNVTAAVATVAEDLAEGAYIGTQVGLVDPNPLPDVFDKLILCYDRAGILNQDQK